MINDMTDIDIKIGKKYFDGLTDYKIAKALDITESRVASWRKMLGLPRNPRILVTVKRDYKHVKTLYDAGYNDAEISEASDMSIGKIESWRRTNNLPANKQKRFSESSMMELYKLRLPDEYVARLCGTHTTCVRDWRHANNLPYISQKQRREILEEADKVPVTELFDKQSLFYNSKFIRQFVSGEITNG